MSILVFLEQDGSHFHRTALESLAAAQQTGQSLGMSVAAVVVGAGVEPLASNGAAWSVEQVYALDHALLRHYTPDGFTIALEQLIRKLKPEYIIFPHTYQVRDFG